MIWVGGLVAVAMASTYLGLGADLPWRHLRWEQGREFLAAALHPTLVSEETHRSLFADLVQALRGTVVFAVAGMSLALPLGLLLGLGAWDGWWRESRSPLLRGLGRILRSSARTLAAALRSVHELLWAMLWLSAWGLSPFAAVLAIALPYAGILAKVFTELADEAPRRPYQALREGGASQAAALRWGLLPQVGADFSAYAFYRFECALRSAAILGFFGFPTAGYYISLAFENLHYRELWTFLYLLLAMAAVMESWSGRLRLESRRCG